MECKKILEEMSSYLDNQVDEKEKVEIEKHIQSCVSCRKGLEELKLTLSQIHSLKKKEIPLYYHSQLMSKVSQLSEKRVPIWIFNLNWQSVAAVFILGIIAGGGLFLTLSRQKQASFNNGNIAVEKTNITRINTLKLNEYGDLTFTVNSKIEVKNVVFKVELPEGIYMASSPGKKVFSWEGDLLEGENIISLHVKAAKSGNWSVNARVRTDGTVLKTFDMPVTIL